jgi:hypothetical protein
VWATPAGTNCRVCDTCCCCSLACSVWANMRALRCLVLRSLNTPRLRLLLSHYTMHVSVRVLTSSLLGMGSCCCT